MDVSASLLLEVHWRALQVLCCCGKYKHRPVSESRRGTQGSRGRSKASWCAWTLRRPSCATSAGCMWTSFSRRCGLCLSSRGRAREPAGVPGRLSDELCCSFFADRSPLAFEGHSVACRWAICEGRCSRLFGIREQVPMPLAQVWRWGAARRQACARVAARHVRAARAAKPILEAPTRYAGSGSGPKLGAEKTSIAQPSVLGAHLRATPG